MRKEHEHACGPWEREPTELESEDKGEEIGQGDTKLQVWVSDRMGGRKSMTSSLQGIMAAQLTMHKTW